MSKAKVLYVEDEPFLGKIVKESLESRSFHVKMVDDGELVLNAFRVFQPNICVLDVMLPNVDGFTLGSQIRAIDPQMPIIYLTAKNQTEDVIKGFQSGGNDYLKKPFSMEELIIRIDNLMQLTAGIVPNPGSKPPVDGAFSFGDFTFNPNTYELKNDVMEKQLSHREAELLKIFLKNPNQAIDRKEILKEIWGDDSFFNSRNLDVYITKLRNYFKSDESIQIITLKGVGYRFIGF